MKGKEYEIVERSSGYWITDGKGNPDGPYNSIEDAQANVPREGQLQYPLPIGNMGGALVTITGTKKYNHAVDIAFSLVSNHPEGEDITGDMIRTALWNRIRDLDQSDEWGEIAANTVPFDTYEMD